MSKKPILFCTDMVRAILGDRKFKTRRLDKLQEINKRPNSFMYSGENTFAGTERYGHIFVDIDGVQTGHDIQESTLLIKPQYQVGDKLWVRETFRPYSCGYDSKIKVPVEYKADRLHSQSDIRWYPNIHMPKWASRLWLEVTDVKVERLQEITKKDAKAEGVIIRNIGETYWRAFRKIWDSLNAKRGFGWDTNPYVWVYTFKKIEVKE
jgi:hypothetical protein